MARAAFIGIAMPIFAKFCTMSGNIAETILARHARRWLHRNVSRTGCTRVRQ
jgi:hypothetical protein